MANKQTNDGQEIEALLRRGLCGARLLFEKYGCLGMKVPLETINSWCCGVSKLQDGMHMHVSASVCLVIAFHARAM